MGMFDPEGWTGRDPWLSSWCVRLVSASAVRSPMLTIGKLGTSRAQLEYYEQQVASGIEHYYARRHEGGTGIPNGLRVTRCLKDNEAFD